MLKCSVVLYYYYYYYNLVLLSHKTDGLVEAMSTMLNDIVDGLILLHGRKSLASHLRVGGEDKHTMAEKSRHCGEIKSSRLYVRNLSMLTSPLEVI